jgi:uncharacterized membrane protein YGL010W
LASWYFKLCYTKYHEDFFPAHFQNVIQGSFMSPDFIINDKSFHVQFSP